jgi:alpha-beta hydrolase superfamily lysophospholipase
VIFPLLAAIAFTLATLLPCALLGAVLRWWRLLPARYWRCVLAVHAALLPLHCAATFPLALGYVGSRLLGTRPDERAYAGPRLGPDGELLVQSQASLRAEAASGPTVAPDIVAAAAARAHAIASSDGVVLRAFCVEPVREPPVAVAVLVHGLFRSAMELEPVAALLRAQGCECWLLELRNFGGSTRSPFAAGLRESDDVVAAVGHVRRQPGRRDALLVLYGVSLGSVAVSLALPRLDGIAGVVLDSPIDDMLAGARRMLGFARAGDRRSWFRIDEPWQSLVLRAFMVWSDVDLARICPAEVLATLPVDLPVLVVGSGTDDRAPPATVERLFAGLPMHEAKKRLWIVPGVGHGQAAVERPAEYLAHVQWLLAHLRR